MIARLGLKFLGFELPDSGAARSAMPSAFPEIGALDLANWHRLRAGVPGHVLAHVSVLGRLTGCRRFRPPAAGRRALCCVSSHSERGSESATIPAAACTFKRRSLTTAVRIAIATSMSPLKPR